jgi:hypothetical protein
MGKTYTFSTNLFWDVELTSFHLKRNKRFVIQRVLEYGTLSDWSIIKECYGIPQIAKEMQQVRTLDKTSLSFISIIANVQKEAFKCYTLKPSNPQHWNF